MGSSSPFLNPKPGRTTMQDDRLEETLAEKRARLLKELQEVEQEERRLVEEAEAKKKEEEQRKPVSLTVTSITGGGLILKGDVRDDVLEIWRTTPGRAYKGSDLSPLRGPDNQARLLGINYIPIKEWAHCEERLMALPRLTLHWSQGVKQELEWMLNAPPLEIVLHPNRQILICRFGPNDIQKGRLWNAVNTISTGRYEWEQKAFILPTAEGWRLSKVLLDGGFEGVVWDDDALEIVMKDVRQRAELDLVAKKGDSEFFDFESDDGKHPRPFQRVGIEFLAKSGGRTLLGDQTGLGKTWQGLGYSLYRTQIRNQEIAQYSGPEEDGPRPYQTVCIVKASNLPNWEREIKRLTGHTPVLCRGGKPDFWALKQIVLDRAPYVLINYETLATRQEELVATEGGDPKTEEHYLWVAIIQNSNPDLLILDEAHYIKNPAAHRSIASRLLAHVPEVIPMTASPILNRTEELWPLLYMLDPEMFKTQQKFLDRYTWNGRSPRNVEELHALLKPRFLRRLKKDVQPDLPPINRMTKEVVMSDEAMAAYNDVLKGIWTQLSTFDVRAMGGNTMAVMNVLSQITRLKQICANEKMDYTADLATEIQDSNENGGKVLIFTQFKGVAVGIKQRLGDEAISTVYRGANDFVSMDARQRDALFEAARHDPKVKYIVTTQAAQEGHNLEFCNWVIFNDQFWTPEAHNQCEGRAYGRLADPHSIDSYYIIARVEIEQWLMDLLSKKLEIIQSAVEGVEIARETDISIGMELIRRMKEELWRK